MCASKKPARKPTTSKGRSGDKKKAPRAVVRKQPAVSKAKGRSTKPVVAVKAPALKLPVYLVAAVKALDDKKAFDMRILQLGQLSSIADFLVVASGTSEPHLRALRIELEKSLGEAGSRPRGSESQKESGWTVVDAVDVIFHLFREDVRRSYAIESLWKDGLDVPVGEVLKA
jgi:ribosome-associated protein